MQPFTTLTTIAAPLMAANVDTDQIIPKQFLSTVERTGLGKGLFYDLRFDEAGQPREDFVLNQPAYAGAGMLITGPNFGCGSSREHAPWALLDFGLRCVVGESFADIFYNNCFNNGVLPAIVSRDDAAALAGEALGANHTFLIDLPMQTITMPSGRVVAFEIEPARKTKLLKGLDDIGLTLMRESDITAYEYRRRFATAWLK
jgi:3-isopropylmalate dehydratase small subunit